MGVAGRVLKVVRSPFRRPRPVRPSYDGPKQEMTFEAIDKASRQKTPRGVYSGIQVRSGIWYPMIRPEAQVMLTDLVWIVGAVIDRIVEETTKGGWRFDPAFGAKCKACGAEYDTEPEACEREECGSTDFRQADPTLIEPIKKLLERPNWDEETGRIYKTFLDLLKDSVFYGESIDDWHWEIVLNREGVPAQLWPVNSEFMRQFADPSLTVGRYFCPECLDRKGIADATYDTQGLEECPTCATPLEKTAWAQIDERENVVAIWSKKEILHDQARTRGKRILGRSKTLRCWAMAQILRWQELYQWGAYSGNKAPDAVITVSGMTQAEVNAMIDEVEKFKEDHPNYKDYIWLGLSGAAEAAPPKLEVQHVLGKLVDLDAVNLAMHYTKAVAMNWGVSPEMIGIQEAGKLGHPEEVLQVSYDTIEEVQTGREEFVNGQLIPFWPEAAKEWRWRMNPPAPQDEKKKADEALAWVNVLNALRQAGARAKLDPKIEKDWPIEIESWEEPMPPGMPPGGPQAPPGAPPPGGGPAPGPAGEEAQAAPGALAEALAGVVGKKALGTSTPGAFHARYGGRRRRQKGDLDLPIGGPDLDLGVKSWQAYTGPKGGRGWRSTRTGEVRYQDEKPSEGEEGGPEEGAARPPAEGEEEAPPLDDQLARIQEQLGKLTRGKPLDPRLTDEQGRLTMDGYRAAIGRMKTESLELILENPDPTMPDLNEEVRKEVERRKGGDRRPAKPEGGERTPDERAYDAANAVLLEDRGGELVDAVDRDWRTALDKTEYDVLAAVDLLRDPQAYAAEAGVPVEDAERMIADMRSAAEEVLGEKRVPKERPFYERLAAMPYPTPDDLTAAERYRKKVEGMTPEQLAEFRRKTAERIRAWREKKAKERGAGVEKLVKETKRGGGKTASWPAGEEARAKLVAFAEEIPEDIASYIEKLATSKDGSTQLKGFLEDIIRYKSAYYKRWGVDPDSPGIRPDRLKIRDQLQQVVPLWLLLDRVDDLSLAAQRAAEAPDPATRKDIIDAAARRWDTGWRENFKAILDGTKDPTALIKKIEEQHDVRHDGKFGGGTFRWEGPEKNASYTRAQVQEVVDAIPQKHLAGIHTLVMETGRDPGEAMYAHRYGRSFTTAASACSGSVHLWSLSERKYDRSDVWNVVSHEIGHLVAERMLATTDPGQPVTALATPGVVKARKEYIAACKEDTKRLRAKIVQAVEGSGYVPSDLREAGKWHKAGIIGVTSYGAETWAKRGSLAEDFAEAYSLFVMGEPRFKESGSARYAWFVKHFGYEPKFQEGTSPWRKAYLAG